MAPGRMIAGWLTALSFAFALCASLYADSPGSAPSAKQPAATDPFIDAQQQITRLRQTASQLKLLAEQPVPQNLPERARGELAAHEQWLRQAHERISVLASEWEGQLKPLNSRAAVDSANDLNAFFDAQSERLKNKLRRESLAQDPASEPVRSSGTTARIVIDKMH